MMNLASTDLVWCVKRLPMPLLKLLKEFPGRVFVAGGYIRSRITGEPVNDIDLFVPTKEAAQALALAYAEGQSELVLETGNAYTVKGSKPTVQVIHRWTFERPEDVMESFDFTIACAAFWWNGSNWDSVCHESYYADLAGRRLVYLKPRRNEDAGGSMLRVLKFYQRGFRIPLDSLGAVIARLAKGVHSDLIPASVEEDWLGQVLTGLLREVDPNSNPDSVAYLPRVEGQQTEELEF